MLSSSRFPRLAGVLSALLLVHIVTTTAAEQAYPLGCSTQNSKYYDFESVAFPPEDDISIKSAEDYMLVRRLGAGKFSDVFEAVDVQVEKGMRAADRTKNAPLEIDERTLVVLKCLKPVAERKIKRELLVLQHASKLPNLARLLAVVVPAEYNDSSKKYHLQTMPSLVLEHAGVHSQWLCHSTNKGGDEQYLTEEEIQYFLYHLLVALDHLHSAGIMHRDVKPRNVLIDKTDMSLMLIDLGLADFFLPNTKYNVRVASRHYKSPELLLGNENYDYAIDLWGLGCILAGLLFRREPFFRGKDNMDQLGTIVAVLGTADCHAYMSKAKIEMKPEIRQVIAKYTLRGGSRKAWSRIAEESSSSNSSNSGRGGTGSSSYTPSPEGLDLLSKLLVYDHTVRLTAKQAMSHSFFDSVRDRVERQVREKLRKLSQ
jgi:casein kinase II subunit alpha